MIKILTSVPHMFQNLGKLEQLEPFDVPQNAMATNVCYKIKDFANSIFSPILQCSVVSRKQKVIDYACFNRLTRNKVQAFSSLYSIFVLIKIFSVRL